MNIGLDFDGVILDSERISRFAAEYWSINTLGKPRLIRNEVSQDMCFNWTQEEVERFFSEVYYDIIADCQFMPGVNEILKKLSDLGHKFYIITLRGYFRPEEITYAKKDLEKLSITPEQIIWGESNKAKRCEELNIDIMIEDNPKNIELFKNSKVDVFYLRDSEAREVNLKNVTTVYNWMDIYNEILKRSK